MQKAVRLLGAFFNGGMPKPLSVPLNNAVNAVILCSSLHGAFGDALPAELQGKRLGGSRTRDTHKSLLSAPFLDPVFIRDPRAKAR